MIPVQEMNVAISNVAAKIEKIGVRNPVSWSTQPFFPLLFYKQFTVEPGQVLCNLNVFPRV